METGTSPKLKKPAVPFSPKLVRAKTARHSSFQFEDFWQRLRQVRDSLDELTSALPTNFKLNAQEASALCICIGKLHSSLHMVGSCLDLTQATASAHKQFCPCATNLEDKLGLFEAELNQWVPAPADSDAAFVHKVTASLRTYTTFAQKRVPECGPHLLRATQKWVATFDEEAADSAPWLVLSTADECKQCVEYSARLETAELTHIAVCEEYQAELNQRRTATEELQSKLEALKAKLASPLGDFCLDHIRKIRTDLENILDCELPELGEENVYESLPALWMAFRGTFRDLSKKVRGKLAATSSKCSVNDLQALVQQLQEICSTATEQKAHKLKIGEKIVPIVLLPEERLSRMSSRESENAQDSILSTALRGIRRRLTRESDSTLVARRSVPWPRS